MGRFNSISPQGEREKGRDDRQIKGGLVMRLWYGNVGMGDNGVWWEVAGFDIEMAI
jgi:hypothetical protein